MFGTPGYAMLLILDCSAQFMDSLWTFGDSPVMDDYIMKQRHPITQNWATWHSLEVLALFPLTTCFVFFLLFAYLSSFLSHLLGQPVSSGARLSISINNSKYSAKVWCTPICITKTLLGTTRKEIISFVLSKQ